MRKMRKTSAAKTVLMAAWSVAGLALPSAVAEPTAQTASDAVVDATTPTTLSLAQAEPTQPASTEPVTTRAAVETEPAAEEPKLPITLNVSYYLLSDYIFRGINFSEYAGEGRERLNHQMTTAFTFDAGPYGKFGFDTFFEWFEAQQKINPYAGQNLQEVDYTIRWGHSIDPIKTDATVGVSFLTFPNLGRLLRTDKARGNNNDDKTQEWWFRLVHNDAWMWKWLFPKNDGGIINPAFFLAQDCGTGAGAVWMELSFSHTFTIPGVDNLSITPGYLLAADGGLLRRYLNRPDPGGLRMAYEQLSLNVTYDLTPILKLPKWAGTLSISGLLYFNDALGNAEIEHDKNGEIQDEFYGGMSVNWAWGG